MPDPGPDAGGREVCAGGRAERRPARLMRLLGGAQSPAATIRHHAPLIRPPVSWIPPCLGLCAELFLPLPGPGGLAVMAAEGGGERVGRVVADAAGDACHAEVIGAQMVSGQGHPPVGHVPHRGPTEDVTVVAGEGRPGQTAERGESGHRPWTSRTRRRTRRFGRRGTRPTGCSSTRWSGSSRGGPGARRRGLRWRPSRWRRRPPEPESRRRDRWRVRGTSGGPRTGRRTRDTQHPCCRAEFRFSGNLRTTVSGAGRP